MAWLRFWRGRRRGGDGSLPVGSIVPGSAISAPSRVESARRAELAFPASWGLADEPEPLVSPAEESPAQSDVAEAPSGPRVGLVFGDGTHVVLDPDDPRAGRFAALAKELNR